MYEFMESPVLGYERLKIRRNLSECFLGMTPMGETCRFENVGELKGPATLPSSASFARVSETACGC